ncbi:MAG TPA: response regulator transcription factor [Thermoleophilaceae bacterium]|nr:response regulator transcription factor [Thermoleophilaceae bacterium]
MQTQRAQASRLDVLVVDDHEVVRWGLQVLLDRQPWVGRCLTAATAEQALEQARVRQPEVALVDLFVGADSGAELCLALREASPRTRMLLMSGAGRISAPAAQATGATGFVPKDWPAADVVMAVRMVANGMSVFGAPDAPIAQPLSGREQEVLELIARGATNQEIATALALSPHTVKDHASALYRKLDVRNRSEAVRRAARLGLTS